jgi:hypothetical protein
VNAIAITNAQMKPNRYARWAEARKRLAFIQNALRAGRRVTLGTYLRATTYDARHLGMFTADRGGCYVQRGKHRDEISGCAIIVTD